MVASEPVVYFTKVTNCKWKLTREKISNAQLKLQKVVKCKRSGSNSIINSNSLHTSYTYSSMLKSSRAAVCPAWAVPVATVPRGSTAISCSSCYFCMPHLSYTTVGMQSSKMTIIVVPVLQRTLHMLTSIHNGEMSAFCTTGPTLSCRQKQKKTAIEHFHYAKPTWDKAALRNLHVAFPDFLDNFICFWLRSSAVEEFVFTLSVHFPYFFKLVLINIF